MRRRQGMTLGLAALAAVAVLGLAAGRTFASHATCTINGNLSSIFNQGFSSSSSAGGSAIDINTACNNADLRTRTGPEIQGTANVEAGAPGFDPSQLLAFAALDRCIGPLTGTANLESGTGSITGGSSAKSDCQTKGGVVMHGPFSALGPGAVTNNMFGRVITMRGFDPLNSFLQVDSGASVAFATVDGSGGSDDPLAMQGIIVPCTNPLRSLQTGLFTCDLVLLGAGTTSGLTSGFDADGVLHNTVGLASLNMAPNTSSPFTINTNITVAGAGFLVSTDNEFFFQNASGTTPDFSAAGHVCNQVALVSERVGGQAQATTRAQIEAKVTPGFGVSCGIQRITQDVPRATGVEDPAGAGSTTGTSLTSLIFAWFAQQDAGHNGLLSVAGNMETNPRVNFIQLVSQGAFVLDASGFFVYNQVTNFPVATYPTGKTQSLTSVVTGPQTGDPTACIPTGSSPPVAQGGGGPCAP